MKKERVMVSLFFVFNLLYSVGHFRKNYTNLFSPSRFCTWSSALLFLAILIPLSTASDFRSNIPAAFPAPTVWTFQPSRPGLTKTCLGIFIQSRKVKYLSFGQSNILLKLLYTIISLVSLMPELRYNNNTVFHNQGRVPQMGKKSSPNFNRPPLSVYCCII